MIFICIFLLNLTLKLIKPFSFHSLFSIPLKKKKKKKRIKAAQKVVLVLFPCLINSHFYPFFFLLYFKVEFSWGQVVNSNSIGTKEKDKKVLGFGFLVHEFVITPYLL